MGAPKILLMGEGMSLARVTRAKWLLGQLPEGEVDLAWAVPEKYRALVDDGRAEMYNLLSVPFSTYYDNIVDGRPPYSADDLDGYLAADTALINRVRPDLVVYDFRPSAPVAAANAGIPAVSVTNAYWSPFGERLLPVPDNRVVRRVGLRLAGLVLPILAPPMLRRVHEPIFAMRRRAGFDDCNGDVFQLWGGGEHVWFPDTDDMAPVSDAPRNHRRVGPSLWKPDHVGYPNLPKGFGRSRPLVYVSLGSTGDASLLPLITDGLVNIGADVLAMSPDFPLEPTWVRRCRVLGVRYLDGDVACAMAELVVSNGGHPQLMQAFAAGTPVLGVAANIDQLMAMAHATRTGAASCVHVLKATSDSIGKEAKSLIRSTEARDAALLQKNAIASIDTQKRMREALCTALR